MKYKEKQNEMARDGGKKAKKKYEAGRRTEKEVRGRAKCKQTEKELRGRAKKQRFFEKKKVEKKN